jgi:2-oxoglutarate ferredoxin oxidoreductase subunit alpha
MIDQQKQRLQLIDGSRLIVEACVQVGADVYVGYPITPANLIYSYSSQRFPSLLPASDEISALQWMSGLSAAGHLPVTATSFPGFALMIESINMAYIMELPMLIVLVQRLGPATGTATAGAQGDLQLLHGVISGGYPLPVFCIADLMDCWELPPLALETAIKLRTPVVLLTSKEMVMTQASFDLSKLKVIHPFHPANGMDNKSILAQQPAFLAVGNDWQAVRLTASTHDTQGYLQHTQPEAIANTLHLQEKIEQGTPALYTLDQQEGAHTLLVSYGISSGACRVAIQNLRANNKKVSLFVPQTLLPVPAVYRSILDSHPELLFVEENHQGQYARLLYGELLPERVHNLGKVGNMLQPMDIQQAVSA